MTADREAVLRATYAAFNAREIEAVLERMTGDVDWPNAWEDGRMRAHEAVRDYWTRQWGSTRAWSRSASGAREDGTMAVEVDQVARSLDGEVLGTGRVIHVYRFRDGLVSRIDVEEAVSGGA